MSQVYRQTSPTAVGICAALALTGVFALLKLFGVLAWSWATVTSPLWGPPVLFLLIVSLIGVLYIAPSYFHWEWGQYNQRKELTKGKQDV